MLYTLWLLEWLPQCPPICRWSPPHHIHNHMGSILLQNSTPGLHSIRWWLLKTVPTSQTKQNGLMTLFFGADDLNKSFFLVVDWLDLCGHNGIILNPDKFMFGANTVEFAGFEIMPSNVRPCNNYLDAIRDFPTPANITDVHSWFGLINQVSYAFAVTKRMLPFCQLLQPGTPSKWTDELNQLFEESKSVIIGENEEVCTSWQVQPAWQLTGRKMALDSGYSRYIASVHPLNPSAVTQAGRPHWLAATSLMLLNHIMPWWGKSPCHRRHPW